MEPLSGTLMIVGWFLLRFGLPLVVTITICWLLQKLDNRWQNDSLESKEPVHIRKLTTIMNCWLYHDCPKKQRLQCTAYQNPDIPCWQHFRSSDGNLKNRCVVCPVFKSTPAPSYGD